MIIAGRRPSDQAVTMLRGVLSEIGGPDASEETIVACRIGLRSIRRIVCEHGGYRAMREFDDYLFSLVMAIDLRQRRVCGTSVVPPTPLPSCAVFQRSIAIMSETIVSIFFLNSAVPGNEAVLAATAFLIDELVRQLGYLPCWADLLEDVGSPSPPLDFTTAAPSGGLVTFN